jgi:hypothetical protein
MRTKKQEDDNIAICYNYIWIMGAILSLRASETNKSAILLVFLPAFSVAPKVTYSKYAPLGAP